MEKKTKYNHFFRLKDKMCSSQINVNEFYQSKMTENDFYCKN